VSDAGTPGISDPGSKLVEIAAKLGVDVSPIPGPCAAIAALSASGLPADKFLFLGFLPKKGQGRILEQIKNSPVTVCFYESPHRIIKTLETLKTVVSSERRIVVCRELTKKFETIYRGTMSDILTQIKGREKGEFAVIVAAVSNFQSYK
jgi:16S rRNA (cytidine1402-2'-O)-methyltransferase